MFLLPPSNFLVPSIHGSLRLFNPGGAGVAAIVFLLPPFIVMLPPNNVLLPPKNLHGGPVATLIGMLHPINILLRPFIGVLALINPARGAVSALNGMLLLSILMVATLMASFILYWFACYPHGRHAIKNVWVSLLMCGHPPRNVCGSYGRACFVPLATATRSPRAAWGRLMCMYPPQNGFGSYWHAYSSPPLLPLGARSARAPLGPRLVRQLEGAPPPTIATRPAPHLVPCR